MATLDTLPVNQDITIPKGATYFDAYLFQDENGKPYNFFGFTARMQIRAKAGAADPPLLDMTTENGMITLGGVTGQITFLVDKAVTAAIANTVDYAVYDLVLIQTGTALDFLVMKGIINFYDVVTKVS